MCIIFVKLIISAPGEVQPPSIITAGATYLHLGWEEPTLPNGLVTGYFLYQEDVEIYAGGLREFNATDLLVCLMRI